MNSITITCKIVDCDKPRQPGRKDWCTMHYTRWRNNGDPLVSKIDRSIPNVTKMPEYKSWQNMKERCLVPTNKKFADYGGRGIKIHLEWQKSFARFIEYIGLRPGIGYTLERINNNGNYEPGNVRWATRIEQASNRRSSRFFTIEGKTKTLKQWCDIKQLKYKTVHARIRRGIPFLEALH